MKRDVAAMARKEFDVVIVGGGITGACVARDASLRGLSVALVEMNDFASATSGASSKLIHGGLRYLRNFEFRLVRESLRERRNWANNAPHMVDTVGIFVPTRGLGLHGRIAMGVSLTTYDLLSYDRNRVSDVEKRIPAHKSLGRADALALEPSLASRRITGGNIFYDYQMHSPDRLELECLLQADAHGARMANHAGVSEFTRDSGRVTGVIVKDLARGGETHTIRGKIVINAAGPWADLLLGTMEGGEPSRTLVRSKGIHLITRPLTTGYAVAVEQRHGHFFIVPWRGHSLIGTTDTLYSGDPSGCCVTEEDILEFMAIVNKNYPAANLQRDDILHFYAGLRPIVDNESKALKAAEKRGSLYRASRSSEVLDHAAHGGPEGVVTVIGGKWTTSRALAEKVVNLCVGKLGVAAAPCETETSPTHGGHMASVRACIESAAARFPQLSRDTIAHLVRQYGSALDPVCALILAQPELGETIDAGSDTLCAEVVHAVRQEMACTLEDVLFRRTGAGTLGHPGDAALQRVTALMVGELHWDERECAEQHARVMQHYVPGALAKRAGEMS